MPDLKAHAVNFNALLRNAFLFLGAIALGAVILVEGARLIPVLRVVTPRIDAGAFNLDGITQKDLNTFWKLEPNMKLQDLAIPDVPDRRWSMTTNSLGLRGAEPGPKNGRYRILTLGDSTTFGIGVDDGETWPARLQQALDPAATGIEVVNAGSHGTTSFQGLSFLLSRGLAFEPNLIIVTYQFNDQAQAPFSDVAQLAKLRQWGAVTLLRDVIGGLDPAAAQDDRHKRRLTEGEFLDTLVEIGALCNRRNISLVFLSWPFQAEISGGAPVSPYRALVSTAGEITHFPVLDLLPVFMAAPEPPFFDIVHANESGCQLVADTLTKFLADQHILPGK